MPQQRGRIMIPKQKARIFVIIRLKKDENLQTTRKSFCKRIDSAHKIKFSSLLLKLSLGKTTDVIFMTVVLGLPDPSKNFTKITKIKSA